MFRSLACCALLLSVLTGGQACLPALQGGTARDPNRNPPDAFPGATNRGLGPTADANSAAANVAQAVWSQFFASHELRELIQVALVNNQELNIRLQEIVIAQNEAYARQGEYIPRLSAQGGAGLEKPGKYTSQGASDDGFGLPDPLGNFTFGLVGTWEVDIWSKLRDAKKSADLRAFATAEGRNFLVTQIIAEVARSYYDLISLDNRIDILQNNIEVQEHVLEMVKLQKAAARVTELAVQRFEAELFRNKSRVFEFQQERVQAENRINFLVGRYPQTVKRDPESFSDPLPTVMQTGLPAQLLDNRPDVRAAELNLAGAKLDVGVARASFYPSLSIDAGAGFRAFNLSHLITFPASLIYDAAGGLVAPLLNRQAIEAQYQAANARQVQAVFEYERTVIQAFTDVVNQLAAVNNLQNVHDLLTQEVDTLGRAVEISVTLFQSARAQYLEVLQARRDFLEAQMELVDTKRRRFQAMVNIYQALGGGWRTDKAS